MRKATEPKLKKRERRKMSKPFYLTLFIENYIPKKFLNPESMRQLRNKDIICQVSSILLQKIMHNLPSPNKKVGNYTFHSSSILGSGAYSTVYLGEDELTRQRVAIKVIDQRSITDQYMLDTLNSEIAILKSLDHPNIVHLFDVVTTANNIYIIQEFCDGGTLDQLLKKQHRLSERDAICVMVDLINGFSELMSKNIVHRDLKPANIFINGGRFKIGDFGFAKKINSVEQNLMNSTVGTPLYMSPQCLELRWYSAKNDIYSLGVIFFKLLFGRTPWPSNTREELLINMSKTPLIIPNVKEVSNESKNFLLRALQYDEKHRIDWDELKEHTLFKKQEQKLLEEEKRRIEEERKKKDEMLQLQNFIQNKENKENKENNKEIEMGGASVYGGKKHMLTLHKMIVEKAGNLSLFLENLELKNQLNEKVAFLLHRIVVVFCEDVIKNCEDAEIRNEMHVLKSEYSDKISQFPKNERNFLTNKHFNKLFDSDTGFSQTTFKDLSHFLSQSIRESNHNIMINFKDYHPLEIGNIQLEKIKILQELVEFYEISLLFNNCGEIEFEKIYEKIGNAILKYNKSETQIDIQSYFNLRKRIYDFIV